ncbi:chorismate mutase [Marinicauda pacifica]|jgi:isochorismate pyruvate lyase|uniref:chorismate mutase n=1 Tax=Marinicauda pacifica TaxID=1133559 RepID=A0A4S2HE02_9PROT|nr:MULTISPECIES: chorismate mutase [Marinicauda]TGY93812.1 chorismate mutase [Marinicauda pacifica]GGE30523.1 chorismate mutase [Marinicauda pacifica]
MIDRNDLDARTPPQACRTMDDVRDGVDRLDRALVALIAERSRYMEAAARIKPDRGAVRDEDRVEDVVAKVLDRASREGLPRDIAEPVWRELVERSIAYEFEVWDRTQDRD